MAKLKPLDFDTLATMSSDRQRGRAVQRHLADILNAAADADDPDIGTPPTLMKVAAAADAACVSAQTIRNWRRRCPAIKAHDPVTGIDLVDREALRAYLLERFGVLPSALRD